MCVLSGPHVFERYFVKIRAGKKSPVVEQKSQEGTVGRSRQIVWLSSLKNGDKDAENCTIVTTTTRSASATRGGEQQACQVQVANKGFVRD